MEVATPNPPLDGFVEVSTDFIASLTSRRDPLFFETQEKDKPDKLVPIEQEDDVVFTGQFTSNENDDNKSDGSDDIQIIEYTSTLEKARPESVIVKNSAEKTPTTINGVPQGDSSSNPVSEVATSEPNLNNGDPGHSDHNYIGNNSSDSGKCVEVVRVESSTATDNSLMENDKIILVSAEERKFREELRGNFSFLDYRLHCTICDLHIGAKADSVGRVSPSLHRSLGVLICNECKRFTQTDKNRTMIGNHYIVCTWCHQNATLQIRTQRCSECPCVFCEKCIKRNLGATELQTVSRKIDWRCYSCVTKPIWRLRLIAWELMQYLRRKRMQMKTSFPNAAPNEMNDADISRCCYSTISKQSRQTHHIQTSLLKSMLVDTPSANEGLQMPAAPRQYTSILPKPPLQQSSYATPIFSLTSDFTSTSNNSTETQSLNNEHFPPTLQSSSTKEIHVNKNRNSLNKPTESIVIDDTPEIDVNAQNVRNENVPPPLLLVYQGPISANSAKNSSDFSSQLLSFKHQNPVLKSSHTNKQVHTNSAGRQIKKVTENSSTNVKWLANAISSTSGLLESCRNRLVSIDKAIDWRYRRDDNAIKIACALHTFIQTATTQLQEIDSQILENYWSMRKAKGKDFKPLPFDTIATEYGNIIEDSLNNSISEFDPGSFLEVEINSNNDTNSQTSNSEHNKEVTRFKGPFVQLERCDELSSPSKCKLSTTFKSSKKNSVQYSDKIKSLIRKYGIKECSVVLVPLEHLKSFR